MVGRGACIRLKGLEDVGLNTCRINLRPRDALHGRGKA